MNKSPVIKWSGSKRHLSAEIIKNFPKQIDTYYEPFCGGCSVLFSLLNSDIKVKKYVCSDINKDLIDFFNTLRNNPMSIFLEYEKRWNTLTSFNDKLEKQIYYNQIRDNYNKNKNIYDFIFLTRTSINGLVRYNKKGEFNAPYNLNRNGIIPSNFKKILLQWSLKLNEVDIEFICCSFDSIKPTKYDYVFLDPPYKNTKNMYFGGIDFDYFWSWMGNLNCKYSLTFDGKRDDLNLTYPIPTYLYDSHFHMSPKKSSFGSISKKKQYVSESLYVKN